MFNINDVLNALFVQKRLFTSEADFQFALAWEIKNMYSGDDVHLEYRHPNIMNCGRDSYIDIVVEEDGEQIPIELKYKTKGFSRSYNGRVYTLKHHGAQDCGRYDFWKDVERLECFIRNNNRAKRGYVFFLTNDSLYWEPTKKTTIDAMFRIHEGRTNVHGNLAWMGNPSSGTTKGRTANIHLDGNYDITWTNYNLNPDLIFKYTVVEVVK